MIMLQYTQVWFLIGFYARIFSVVDAARWGGGKKHEIYVAAFGGHFFMTYFYRAGGGAWPPRPLDPLLIWLKSILI